MANSAFTRALSEPTPQMEQDREDQVVNNAGGFVFQVDDRTRLERFLILGTDGGTYYSDEKKLTKDNVKFLVELIRRDEAMVESVVEEVSTTGRAFRNSPAIFTVAALFAYGKNKNKSVFRNVVRTATHLFEFAEYVELLGGWGKAKRHAVASWYTTKTPEQLAYQVVKYRQRNGWTHQDMLRLSHPVGVDQRVGDFVLHGNFPDPVERLNVELLLGFQNVQKAANIQDVLRELEAHKNLPWEAVPTEFHKNVELWKALFYNGQLSGQALLRNITRLARLAAFDDLVFARDYADKLVNPAMIQRTRTHPIQYLLALHVHQNGQLDRVTRWRTNKDWRESSIIVDALNAGFYAAFKYVEPANKRTMIGLDVSGSMSSQALGLELSCAQISAAMSMSVARTEPYYQILGFADQFRDLGITPSMNLRDVMHKVQLSNFGSTDCAVPMLHCLKNKIEIDTFLVVTDNETWAGSMHPYQALREYRQKTGIDAKLVVAGLTSTGFSIADPKDRGMLDVVGADANLPKLVTEFSAGRI